MTPPPARHRERPDEPLPATSLIICSRGRPKLLAETVRSVLDGAEVPAEVVIVDQSAEPHPTLSTFAGARGCRVRYIRSRATGLCRARNEAIAAAQHDLLVFTDDDMTADPGWFGALVRALVAAGHRAAATGRVLAGPREVRSGFVPALVESERPAVYVGRLDRDVLAAGSMALWRIAIDEVGDFDERLGAGSRFAAADDNDYGFRLLEAGYAIVYVPESVLYHRAWRTSGEYLPVRWSYGRGKGGFYAKYARRGDRRMLRRAARDVLRRVGNVPRRLARGAPRAALGEIVYLLGVLSAAAEWVATERRAR